MEVWRKDMGVGKEEKEGGGWARGEGRRRWGRIFLKKILEN